MKRIPVNRKDMVVGKTYYDTTGHLGIPFILKKVDTDLQTIWMEEVGGNIGRYHRDDSGCSPFSLNSSNPFYEEATEGEGEE